MRSTLGVLAALAATACFSDPPTLGPIGTGSAASDGRTDGATTGDDPQPTDEQIHLFDFACVGQVWSIVDPEDQPTADTACAEMPGPAAVTTHDDFELRGGPAENVIRVVPPMLDQWAVIGRFTVDVGDFVDPGVVVEVDCQAAVSTCNFAWTVGVFDPQTTEAPVVLEGMQAAGDPRQLIASGSVPEIGDEMGIGIGATQAGAEPPGEHAFFIDPRVIDLAAQ